MKKSIKQVCIYTLAVLTLVCTIGFVLFMTSSNNNKKVDALSAGDTITYPFRMGTQAYDYGIQWSGAAESSTDAERLLFYNFSTAGDFSGATDNGYIAIQIYMDKAIGLYPIIDMSSGSTSVRARTVNSGTVVYFVAEDGTVSTHTVPAGYYITPPVGSHMMLIKRSDWILLSSVAYWNNVTAIGMQVFGLYGHSFTMKLGEMGYYNGDPTSSSASFTKVVSMNSQSDYTNKWWWDNGNQSGTYQMAGSTHSTALRNGNSFTNPFASDSDTYKMTWNIASQTSSNSWNGVAYEKQSNWNIASTGFIGVAFKLTSGNGVGLGFYLQYVSGGTTYRMQAVTGTCDGNPAYVIADGRVNEIDMKNGAITVTSTYKNKNCMLLVPISSLAMTKSSFNYSSIKSIVLDTDANDNYNFTIQLGNVAYYSADPATNSAQTIINSNSATTFDSCFDWFGTNATFTMNKPSSYTFSVNGAGVTKTAAQITEWVEAKPDSTGVVSIAIAPKISVATLKSYSGDTSTEIRGFYDNSGNVYDTSATVKLTTQTAFNFIKFSTRVGASIRMSDMSGIRFAGYYDKTTYDSAVTKFGSSAVKVGMLVMPYDIYTANGVEDYTVAGLTAKGVTESASSGYIKAYSDGFNTAFATAEGKSDSYYGATFAFDQLESNYARNFIFRSFIELDGVILYGDFNTTDNNRNLYEVAKSAYPNTQSGLRVFLNKFINSVVNVGISGTTVSYTDDSVIGADNRAYTVEVEGTEATITSTQHFSRVICNGKGRSVEPTLAGGVYTYTFTVPS